MKHNWNKKSLPDCAKVHLEEIIEVFYNYADKKAKEKKIKSLIEHYEGIRQSL